MCITDFLARFDGWLRKPKETPALLESGPFREKAMFLWCYWDVYGGDVAKIAQALVDANFEAAYVHTNDGTNEGGYSGKINCTPALVQALKAAGLTVYGWGAPYGANRQAELMRLG